MKKAIVQCVNFGKNNNLQAYIVLEEGLYRKEPILDKTIAYSWKELQLIDEALSNERNISFIDFIS